MNLFSLADAISSLQAITVGSTGSSASILDSIYVMNTCSRNSVEDSIRFNSLPASVVNYSDSSYSGYSANRYIP